MFWARGCDLRWFLHRNSALADLLPEVAFHDHDRGKLTATFLLGIAIAVGIENLPGHSHQVGHDHDHGSHGSIHQDHEDHSGHNH